MEGNTRLGAKDSSCIVDGHDLIMWLWVVSTPWFLSAQHFFVLGAAGFPQSYACLTEL